MKVKSVDPGKDETKLAYVDENREIKTESFKTRMTIVDDLHDIDIIGEENFKVEYEGEKYIIGSQGEIDATDERSKKNKLHKLSTLVAVTQMLKPEEKEIILINNIPSTSYKSKVLKQEYVDFYKSDKEIEITVNDIPYSFTISEVEFLPESVGFIFKYPELCVGRVCVIDIGKFNIGLIMIENGVIKLMTTLDFGGTELENKTIELLESALDKGINRSKIIDYLKNGYVESWGQKITESESIIERSKFIYLDDVIREASKKKVDLETMEKLFFIGGTSLLLKEEIQSHNKLSKISNIPNDAQYISVIGNLLYGVRKYNGKKQV